MCYRVDSKSDADILSLNIEPLKLQAQCSKCYCPIQKYSLKKGRCENIFMQTLIEKPTRPKKTMPEVRNCGDRKVGIEE